MLLAAVEANELSASALRVRAPSRHCDSRALVMPGRSGFAERTHVNLFVPQPLFNLRNNKGMEREREQLQEKSFFFCSRGRPLKSGRLVESFPDV